MKRESDLIRKLLFQYEADDDFLIMGEGNTSGSSQAERKIGYHQELMADEGLLVFVGKGTLRLTSYGHDYLEAIRDDNVWKKTKEGAAKIGGSTLGIMKDIAVAIIKQEAAEKLGIKL